VGGGAAAFDLFDARSEFPSCLLFPVMPEALAVAMGLSITSAGDGIAGEDMLEGAGVGAERCGVTGREGDTGRGVGGHDGAGEGG
jgi:hypothetical protein